MGDKQKGSMTNAIDKSMVIDIDDTVGDIWEPEETPLRPIFCLKNKSHMKKFEEKEDCFILDFDPDDDSFDPSNHSNFKNICNNDNSNTPEISVIAEKGQVACRDYPHSRHVCAKYPFEKTPHEKYCVLCYCYVCDTSAPCKNWTGQCGHCHAIDNEAWKFQRKDRRKNTKIFS